MHWRTVFVVAAAALLPGLSACDQPTGAASPDAAVVQRAAPTSAIDPGTGEPVALNYRPEGRVVTIPQAPASSRTAQAFTVCPEYEPDCYTEPCDPILDYGCQPCPANDPSAWCYTPPCTPLISTFTEYRYGNQPLGALEVSGTTASGCGYLVLTGIGARINGSDDYTTLHLRGRRLNPDGSWGETVTYRFGPNPNHSLEAWGEVPASATDFYGIVGVRVGQRRTEDLKTLVIFYRKLELTSAGVRATGPTFEGRFGVDPNSPLWDLTIWANGDNQVLVGAGFRSVDGEVTVTGAAYAGNLP